MTTMIVSLRIHSSSLLRLMGILMCMSSLYVFHLLSDQLSLTSACLSGAPCDDLSSDNPCNCVTPQNGVLSPNDVKIEIIRQASNPPHHGRHVNYLPSNVLNGQPISGPGNTHRTVQEKVITRIISLRNTIIEISENTSMNSEKFNKTIILIDEVLSILKKSPRTVEPPQMNKKPKQIDPEESKNRLQQHGLCTEVYLGSTFGYPFYEKGFAIINCDNISVPVGKKISAVFNFAHSTHITTKSIISLLASFYHYYPSVQMYLAVADSIPLNDILFSKVYVDISRPGDTPGSIWTRLLSQVTTDFVFVAANMASIDGDAGIDRLLRTLVLLDVPIVGGATRLANGYWDMDCTQTVFRNYSLLYTSGYWHSQNECVLCTHISSPFVARTEFLLKHKLHANTSRDTLFTEYFLALSQSGYYFAVCPDSMFHISGHPLDNRNRDTWLPMARRWKINQIRFPDKTSITYACDELYIDCAFYKGVAVPPCCLKLLASQIKFIMRTCQDNNLICELQEGTLLGAVKMGKVLPWERDGDITVLSSNFTAFTNLSRIFLSAGYALHVTENTRCCVESRIAGGTLTVSGQGSPWHVELYGQHRMDTEKQLSRGLEPTKIIFDGMWVNTPRNPGRHVRNRYGHEVYRHSEHWITLGRYSGWEEYDTSQGFPRCPVPGSHYCLDKYPADGNLQFREL